MWDGLRALNGTESTAVGYLRNAYAYLEESFGARRIRFAGSITSPDPALDGQFVSVLLEDIELEPDNGLIAAYANVVLEVSSIKVEPGPRRILIGIIGENAAV